MKFGLIGYPLTHSFSKQYFDSKFQTLGLTGFSYTNFQVENIEMVLPILGSDVFGLNVTIPHKTNILKYIDEIDDTALQIGAVNTLVRIAGHLWKGYNTDQSGFKLSVEEWMKGHEYPERALVLGTGGAAKAIRYALLELGIRPYMVSRDTKGDYSYTSLTKDVIRRHLLIVNATPLGMEPLVNGIPLIPYEGLTPDHWLFDIVYNPTNTLFLSLGIQKGTFIKNGLEMLHLQAEHAWMIWKTYGKF